jgi:4-hydroxybenzoate polyprenyltransferase
MWGFGTLTPYAGWAATGAPVGSVGSLVLLGFCPLFAALYPLTQLYQVEEDARRGDRTLALRLGIGRSLVVSMVAVALAFVLFGLAGLRSHWGSHDRWRWLPLTLAFVAWLLLLLPWLRRHQELLPSDHQRGMYRALCVWALTDLAVVLAWAT